MSDLLKGLTSGGWSGFFAWVAPNLIVLASFWICVYEPMQHPPFFSSLGVLSTSELWATLLTIATALGVISSASSTPLYRMLEGYSWPKSIARWRHNRHVELKRKLQNKVTAATPGWEQDLYQEELNRYPLEVDQILPTRLGNAMRAFETYGGTRFGLDSGSLWSELVAVAPKALQDDIDTARAIVDFFVAGFYTSVLAGILAIFAGSLSDGHVSALFFGAVYFLIAWGAYEMAVSSCTYWAATNRALVNIGRPALATALGLQLPTSLPEEIDMWSNVITYTYYRDYPSGSRFDRYRLRPKGQ